MTAKKWWEVSYPDPYDGPFQHYCFSCKHAGWNSHFTIKEVCKTCLKKSLFKFNKWEYCNWEPKEKDKSMSESAIEKAIQMKCDYENLVKELKKVEERMLALKAKAKEELSWIME